MTKPHNIFIKEPYFNQIESGIKTTEGRSGKIYNNMKIGDTIIFQNKEKSIEKKINGIRYYKTLEDYLNIEGYKNCIPNAKSLEEAIKAYHTIPGYMEKIKKFGIIGIKI